MIRRITALCIFAALLAACLTGCGTYKSDENTEEVNIVATVFPQYDFARNIAGSSDGIYMLLSPGAESHTYDPTPSDIIKITECDIFIMTGGESDEWARDILESMDTSNMTIISLMDCVEVLEEEITEGMDAAVEEETEYDEHVWTSPQNAMIIVEAIYEAMAECYPENAQVYKENTEEYQRQLEELNDTFIEIVENAERNVIIVGDRFPFRYLAECYGLEYYAAFPGCSSESEPGVKTIIYLIDKMRDEDIPVVFYIEFSNKRTADAIAEDTGAQELLLHSCHTVSKKEFESGVGYIDIMYENAQNLRTALN